MKITNALLILMVLVGFTSADDVSLHLQMNTPSKLLIGEYDVEVQILDDSGNLQDIDYLKCILTPPYGPPTTVDFRRVSVGTYSSHLNFDQANIYYMRFLASKPGFFFTGTEQQIYAQKNIPLDPTTYILPAAILIIIFGGIYLWRTRKNR